MMMMSPAPSAQNTILPSAEQRRRAAWAVAEQCIHVLKQHFGAAEVIVFGALRGDTPWHDDSEVVRGISPEKLLQAYRCLETIVPSWLPFDLVMIEQSDERIRALILQLAPIPNNTYLALKMRLEDELSEIEL